MMKKYFPLLLITALAFFLRIYKISSFPPGLYSDETTYGYNAYSLLKTGKDEYGKSWPLTFKSFGDYKPPLTAWLTIPSVAIFGLNEFAVRLPSVIAGTLTVLIIYFLSKEIFPQSPKFSIAKLSALLLAISPWHLEFSRSSMLVGIEAMFISLGLLLFLKGLKQPKWLYLSPLSFAAAMYTYYGSRVTVALLALTAAIIFRKEVRKLKKHVIGAIIIGVLALLPLTIAIIKTPETLTGRARTISVFYDPGVRAKLWYSHSIDGENFPVVLSRFFHNKIYYYARDIAHRYFQHLSYDFWVRTGDTTPPFDIPNMGVVYLADLIFVFYGVFLAFRQRTQKQQLLLSYLFISPIAASFTFITPAANRSFNMVIGWTILTALGISTFARKFKSAIWLLIICYVCSFGFYLYQYYVTTPQEMAYKWHYGRKELVKKISAIEDKYDEIVFSNHEGPAYIWLLFYKQYDPQKYWQTAKIDEKLDDLGWLHVEGFDKYRFPRNFEWRKEPYLKPETKLKRVLYVGYEEGEIPLNDFWRVAGNNSSEKDKYGKGVSTHEVGKILYPNGKTAFQLVELKYDY